MVVGEPAADLHSSAPAARGDPPPAPSSLPPPRAGFSFGYNCGYGVIGGLTPFAVSGIIDDLGADKKVRAPCRRGAGIAAVVESVRTCVGAEAGSVQTAGSCPPPSLPLNIPHPPALPSCHAGIRPSLLAAGPGWRLCAGLRAHAPLHAPPQQAFRGPHRVRAHARSPHIQNPTAALLSKTAACTGRTRPCLPPRLLRTLWSARQPSPAAGQFCSEILSEGLHQKIRSVSI